MHSGKSNKKTRSRIRTLDSLEPQGFTQPDPSDPFGSLREWVQPGVGSLRGPERFPPLRPSCTQEKATKGPAAGFDPQTHSNRRVSPSPTQATHLGRYENGFSLGLGRYGAQKNFPPYDMHSGKSNKKTGSRIRTSDPLEPSALQNRPGTGPTPGPVDSNSQKLRRIRAFTLPLPSYTPCHDASRTTINSRIRTSDCGPTRSVTQRSAYPTSALAGDLAPC